MQKLTDNDRKNLDKLLERADIPDQGICLSKEKGGKYIRTPWNLCEEIVGQIAALSPLRDKKILVVDTMEFIPVLLAFDAEKCNITYVAQYAYKGKISELLIWKGVPYSCRVVQKSLLDWETDMKFDIVIGNPPYQDHTGQNTIYPKFYNTSRSLLNKNGIISLITPTAIIRGLLVGENVDGIKMSPPIQTKFLRIGDSIKEHYFPDVSSTFCWFIQENLPITSPAVIRNDAGMFRTYSPLFPKKTPNIVLSASILDKCFTYQNGPYTPSSSDHGKKAVPDENGKHKAIVRIDQSGGIFTRNIRWIENHPHFNRPKIVVGTYGARAVPIYNHQLVSAAQSAGLSGHNIGTTLTNSDVESDILSDIVNKSKLCKFFSYVTDNKRCQAWHFLAHVKSLPLSSQFSDDNLFKHFNLSQEEIDHIEETLK